MRVMRLASAALFAVLAFSAMAASDASAFHPLFLTQSGQELLISGLFPDPIFRFKNAGILGTWLCLHVVFDGWVLHHSTLVHRLRFLFLGECKQKVGSNEEGCNEPIEPKLGLGELGLLVLPSGKRDIALLIRPSEGTEFVKLTCGANTITVEGAIVGVFPEVNRNGVNQYNKELTKAEISFKAEGGTEKQEFTSIELLGTNMTGTVLKVSGFFGGEASEEATGFIESDGGIIICTQ